MFKFNFTINEENIDNVYSAAQEEDQCNPQNITCVDCEEIKFRPDMLNTVDKLDEFIVNKELIIFYINTDSIQKCLEKSNKQFQNHTDLIPGTYEGGGKIWECTQDLCDFIINENIYSNLCDKHILDLGCGAGILGILSLKAGAFVHFQDYNKEILTSVTIPNVAINFDISDSNNIFEKCKFYSGDWQNYIEYTRDELKFDIILTSETIYNIENYKKLINTLKCKLKPNGIIYLAAKIYYFGVGGGIRHFQEQLNTDGILTSEIIWFTNKNVQREILKITFK